MSYMPTKVKFLNSEKNAVKYNYRTFNLDKNGIWEDYDIYERKEIIGYKDEWLVVIDFDD